VLLSRLSLGPTQSAVQQMQGTVFPGVKQPEDEDEDDSFLSFFFNVHGTVHR
jgi:hypothetical protein